MDRNIYDDIGSLFRDGINPLSEQPQKEVWENIEKQLDKDDAVLYKKRFLFTRRMVAILLFILLGFATVTIIFTSEKTSNATRNNSAQNKQNQSKAGTTYVDPGAGDTLSKNNMPSIATKKSQVSAIDINSINHLYSSRVFLKKIAEDNHVTEFLSNKIADKNQSSLNYLPDSLAELTTNPKFVSPLNNPVEANTTDVATHLLLNTFVTNDSSKSAKKITGKSLKKTISANSKFSIAIYVAPETTQYHLVNNPPNTGNNSALIEKREKQDLSYSTGFLAGYALNKKLIIKTGVNFSRTNINTTPAVIYAEKTSTNAIQYRYNTSAGYGYVLPGFSSSPAVGDSIIATRTDQTIQHVNIPLLLSYRRGNKKFTLAAGGGLELNFLQKARLHAGLIDAQNNEEEAITNLQGVKKINLSLLLQSQLQYRLKNNFSLFALPYFKMALSPISNQGAVKNYPYEIGIGLGASYSF